MLAAALAAMILAANDPATNGPAASGPAMISNDPLARPERAVAVAYCMAPQLPEPVFKSCVRSIMRDEPARRAFGEAYRWARPVIDGAGWAVRAADPDKVALTRDGGGTRETPRAWLRVEKREESGPDPHLSAVTLFEFDCTGEKMQILQSTLYVGRNWQGAAKVVAIDNPKWEYANPGAISDSLLRERCPPTQTASTAKPVVDPDPR